MSGQLRSPGDILPSRHRAPGHRTAELQDRTVTGHALKGSDPLWGVGWQSTPGLQLVRARSLN